MGIGVEVRASALLGIAVTIVIATALSMHPDAPRFPMHRGAVCRAGAWRSATGDRYRVGA